MTTSIICLAVGSGLLVFAVWERMGRGPNARAWTTSATESGVRLSLFVVPGAGLLALALGLAPWLADGPLAFVVLPVVLVGVVLLGWAVLRLPYPAWMVPGWAREKVARRFGKDSWLR